MNGFSNPRLYKYAEFHLANYYTETQCFHKCCIPTLYWDHSHCFPLCAGKDSHCSPFSAETVVMFPTLYWDSSHCSPFCAGIFLIHPTLCTGTIPTVHQSVLGLFPTAHTVQGLPYCSPFCSGTIPTASHSLLELSPLPPTLYWGHSHCSHRSPRCQVEIVETGETLVGIPSSDCHFLSPLEAAQVKGLHSGQGQEVILQSVMGISALQHAQPKHPNRFELQYSLL